MRLLPHNQTAVDSIMENFKNGKRKVIYISGVGTGKSFVFLGVLERLRISGISGKVLYVIPKYAIRDNIRTYDDFTENGDNVEFVTYNAFKTEKDGMGLLRGVSFVLIDECHHMMSDLYGLTLLKCVVKTGLPCLGITATPEIDNGKDTVARLFDARVDGITNFDAIRAGLMPEIIYHVCRPEDDPEKVVRDSGEEVRAKLVYDNADTVIAPVIRKYSRKKWICFFPNFRELTFYTPLVRSLFPGYRIITLRSDLNNLSDVMDEILTNEHVVILSVNILLEGVHLPEIDGIILFRNVQSLTAFQQMIGRVCAISKKVSPVVIDCSESAKKLLYMLMNEDGMLKTGVAGNASIPVKKPVIRIGIGSEEVFDIKTLLRYINGPKASADEKAEKILEGVKERGGNLYGSFKELRTHVTEYRIFKAVCWQNGMKPEHAAKRLYA